MKSRKNTALYEYQLRCKKGTEKCANAWCGSTKDLTVDHIVPVVFLQQLGMNTYETLYNLEDNFQILCRYCNIMKGGRIDPRNPKTYIILKREIYKAEKEAKESFPAM